MIHVICWSVSGRGDNCPVMEQDALTSLDTGRLLYSNPRRVFLHSSAPAPPRCSPWGKQTLAQRTLLPSFLRGDGAFSFFKPWSGSQSSMFPFVRADFWACPWHDTVQSRIEVVAPHATGLPMPRTLLRCFEFGCMKYAMFAGVPGSFSSAPLCFHSGSRPGRALRLWKTPLPLCRARSVWCAHRRSCSSVRVWMHDW